MTRVALEGCAVSAHVYLGVMALGASRHVHVAQSHETWKPGIAAREAAGNPVPHVGLDAPIPKDARLVLANPPCSRFSCGSTFAYKKHSDAFEDLSAFPELLQVVEIFERAPRAEILWWETGPLIRTKGLGMVESAHRRLRAKWTLLLPTDPRWSGIPQARPRCHVIHCTSDAPPPCGGRPSAWPISTDLGSWMTDQLTRRWRHDGAWTLVKDPFHRDCRTPAETARLVHAIGTFSQSTPRIVRPTDPCAPTVLSGRTSAWDDQPGPSRWWSAEEFAVLMTAPPEWGRGVELSRPNRMWSTVALSKGVVGDVAARVCEDYVVPALQGTRRHSHDEIPVEEIFHGGFTVRQLTREGPSTGVAQRPRLRSL